MLETGDIICVSGNSLFKNIIAWFTRTPQEEKTYAKHIAGMYNKYTVTEALITVKDTDIDKWIKKHKKFEIWRYKNLREVDKKRIRKYLELKKGNIYGGWKLIFFALDFILTKIFKKDIYLFRSFLFGEKFPICSWLYSYAYDNINYRFNNLDPNYVDPDTMHDFIERDENWELIYKK